MAGRIAVQTKSDVTFSTRHDSLVQPAVLFILQVTELHLEVALFTDCRDWTGMGTEGALNRGNQQPVSFSIS